MSVENIPMIKILHLIAPIKKMYTRVTSKMYTTVDEMTNFAEDIVKLYEFYVRCWIHIEKIPVIKTFNKAWMCNVQCKLRHHAYNIYMIL